MEGRCIKVCGVVQGVGFRPWVYRIARTHHITGRVRNDAAGVTIEAFGASSDLDGFIAQLQVSPPPAAAVRDLRWAAIPPESVGEFIIVASNETPTRRVSIPPDLATCPECLSEVSNPGDRRFRYPFTNCTNCGPRFTISLDIPYDRATTTMAAFSMCPDCRGEYESIHDRRFHAEPNACPTCGPTLRLLAADGRVLATDDALADAAAALLAGEIVGLKGLGGFHVACDATVAATVRRLRARKHRDEKPLAVMVASLAVAEDLAELSAAERLLLGSVERPIVLVRRREPSSLAPELAPRNPLVGLMLPYTPLHHLLMRAVSRPLVMTSGNLSEEPMAFRNDDAVVRLRGIVDLFVVHDREIATRCDDSVTRVIAGGPVILRRARGYVPRAIPTLRPFRQPVLACGAHLKNTFCIGTGDAAYLGPHIGDLDNLETYQSYEAAVARFERFLAIRPELIAHDLHPDYLSTAYARTRSDVPAIGVQHHHAHIASAMAEHQLSGPVLGVAFDGTGYGPDGAAWGGEVMLADFTRFDRLATVRPIALAGGDTAIRQVWRLALAAVDDACGADAPLDAIPLFHALPKQDMRVVRQMIASRFNAPLAHGVGRYFDAIGALVLGRTAARYEGQVAMELDWIAEASEPRTYPFDVDRSSIPWIVDLRALVRAVIADLTGGVTAPVIAARFQNALIQATATVVRQAMALYGRLPVVLTGGCFQNARLAEGVRAALGAAAVYLHRQVPPGDGGIALGQACVADALARLGR